MAGAARVKVTWAAPAMSGAGSAVRPGRGCGGLEALGLVCLAGESGCPSPASLAVSLGGRLSLTNSRPAAFTLLVSVRQEETGPEGRG